jgi:hypothetical protein
MRTILFYSFYLYNFKKFTLFFRINLVNYINALNAKLFYIITKTVAYTLIDLKIVLYFGLIFQLINN